LTDEELKIIEESEIEYSSQETGVSMQKSVFFGFENRSAVEAVGVADFG